MPFWDERFAHITAQHPQLQAEQVLIDALAAMVVLNPGRFDVIVASNLFGDILSDLAAAVAGSIGIAPSGNLNPERELPSMFEPVHGSAPDIAGQGIANPIGAIWSGAQMLEHLGETEAAAAVLDAIERMLADGGPRTRDLGGNATTADVTAALVSSFQTPDAGSARDMAAQGETQSRRRAGAPRQGRHVSHARRAEAEPAGGALREGRAGRSACSWPRRCS